MKIKQLLFLTILTIGITFLTQTNLCPTEASQKKEPFKPKYAMETKHLKSNHYKFRIGKLWGIYDDTKVLTIPKYHDIIPLGDVYAVKKDGYWGIVNYSGEETIEPYWDTISDLTGDEYRIEKNDLYGWVHKEGRIVKSPQFTYIKAISDDIFSVCSPETGCGALTSNGKKFLPLYPSPW